MNLQPWASKVSILHKLIQPGKYMNTFSFIRWPRSRLHGHFYSVPALKFIDASEPPTGKQRLQWQSLSVGRLYLSFQRDSPLHLTCSIPMDRVQSRNKKVQLETLVLPSKTRPACHPHTALLFFRGEGSDVGMWTSVLLVCDLVLTFTIIHNVWMQVSKRFER